MCFPTTFVCTDRSSLRNRWFLGESLLLTSSLNAFSHVGFAYGGGCFMWWWNHPLHTVLCFLGMPVARDTLSLEKVWNRAMPKCGWRNHIRRPTSHTGGDTKLAGLYKAIYSRCWCWCWCWYWCWCWCWCWCWSSIYFQSRSQANIVQQCTKSA